MAMTNQPGTSLQSFRGDTGKSFKPRTGFMSWLLGNPDTFRQIPKHSADIMQQLQGLLSQGFQGLQNPYQGFEDISNEAVHRYQTEGVPSLAERFTSMGGGQRSSAFQSALASGQGDLQRSLAAMKQGFGQQNRQGLLEQLNLGLKNQPEFQHMDRQGGALENIFAPFLSNKVNQSGGPGDIISILGKLLPLLL